MRNNNDRIFDLLSGTLSPAEESRLRQEIAADPELAEELRLQTLAVEWLEDSETPTLSEFESAQLRAAVRSSVSPTKLPTHQTTPRRSSTRMTWAIGAAALILAVVGVVSVLPKLVGTTSADNVAIAEATQAPQPATGSRISDEQMGATEEMSQATTTTAAAATTVAPATEAAADGFDDEGFSFGDLTAAEYFDMAESTLERSTVASDYATDTKSLEVCLQDLSDAGFTSFTAEVSTYSGDVLFAERFDENGTLVEVVKIVIEGCAEIDRAP